MPEGHVIHRLAEGLTERFGEHEVRVSSPQGRFADGAALLDGREVLEATSWGKHLFVSFDDPHTERILHVHLGLIGRFDVLEYAVPGRVAEQFGDAGRGPTPLPQYVIDAGDPDDADEGVSGIPVRGDGGVPPAVGAVRVRLLNDTHVADLRGATLCEVATAQEMTSVMDRLGPDPLRAGSDPERAWERLRRSNRSFAELLMDQAVLAGVGNVFRCEVLFRHRVDPFVPGSKVKRRTWEAIWADLVELLAIGVAYGQILTMDDQVADARETLALGIDAAPMERRFSVYRRAGEPCRVCGSRIRTMLVAGRNLFWCGRCQRRH